MERSSYLRALTPPWASVGGGSEVTLPWAADPAKLKKLFRRVKRILDDTDRERAQRAESLKRVLQKLKRRQHDLERYLGAECDRNEAMRLERRVAVLKAMRKKGVLTLREEQRRLG